MPDGKIVLYDLPSKKGEFCWSPNVWKSRCLLNYKALPYDTIWVDFPDIEPVLRSHGVAPASTVALGANVGTQYTLPAIQVPSGHVIMDSLEIAAELDRMHPLPSINLHLGLELPEQAQAILRKIAWPLYPELAPRIRDNLLTEHGKPHWVAAREKLFGMTIDQVHQAKGGEPAWAAAQPAVNELVQFVKANKLDDGPFVLGSKVSYSDFVIVAFLKSASLCGNDIFENIVHADIALQAQWTACQKWLEMDR